MIIVPVLVLTLAVAAKIYSDRSTTYWATGTELLVAGRGQASAADQVEIANVGIDLLEDLWTQPSTLRQLTSDGLSNTFRVEVSETGPTLRLEVTGDSAEQAVATAERLVELAPQLLVESLGEQDAEHLTVEQAVAGTPEDAEPAADGTFTYSTVIVVGTSPRTTLNPFPASLATVRSLVTIANSLPFQAAVGQAIPGATFEVTGNVREAPMLSVTAWAPTDDGALAAHQFVLETLRTELDTLQANAVIDADARTQMQTLVPATFAVPTPTSKVRPVAAVVVLGSGLAIGLATLVEAIAAERRRRAAGGGGGGGVGTPSAGGDSATEPEPEPDAATGPGDDGPVETPSAPAISPVRRRTSAGRS